MHGRKQYEVHGFWSMCLEGILQCPGLVAIMFLMEFELQYSENLGQQMELCCLSTCSCKGKVAKCLKDNKPGGDNDLVHQTRVQRLLALYTLSCIGRSV